MAESKRKLGRRRPQVVEWGIVERPVAFVVERIRLVAKRFGAQARRVAGQVRVVP